MVPGKRAERFFANFSLVKASAAFDFDHGVLTSLGQATRIPGHAWALQPKSVTRNATETPDCSA